MNYLIPVICCLTICRFTCIGQNVSAIYVKLPEIMYKKINGEEYLIRTNNINQIIELQDDSLGVKEKFNGSTLIALQNTGLDKRWATKIGDLHSLANEDAYEISFKICVDQSGEVVLSKLQNVQGINDRDLIRKCQELLFDYKYISDTNAPKLDCGIFKLKNHRAEDSPK